METVEINFGASFLERMDIWTQALNRAFKDLELSLEAKVKRVNVECYDHIKDWETDRIAIEVKRT